MYEIQNRKQSPTTVALPGRGIHLAPFGAKDNAWKAPIRDREAKEPTVQALKNNRTIKLVQLKGVAEPPEDPKSESFLEHKRISAIRVSQAGAKARAKGQRPPKRPSA